MLRTLYQTFPLPASIRAWVKGKIPLRWQRQRQFRKFGVINELYFWRLDREIDTVAPIQNYFSNIFPELETATEGQLWIYDRHGGQIGHHEFVLPHKGMHLVRLSNLVDRNERYGTLMWHIRMPDSVARQDAIRDNLVYFTDRGYLCYEKSRSQPAFIHGVDRYAVFQRQETRKYDLFYPEPEQARSWIPEFPLQEGMQEELDVIVVNRCSRKRECKVSVFRNGGVKIFDTVVAVEPRGADIVTLGADVLSRLNGQHGYFMIEGLPTRWGRPAIMRHFSCGAMSIMHC